MTKEELEMRKLVRESDVIDKTDGTELAKAFNHLWEKYVEQEPKTDTWSIKDVADTFKKHGLIKEQEPVLIKQDEKDWLDDRDFPMLKVCIKSLTAVDKIRAEIIEEIEKYNDIYDDTCHGLRMALDIIDKYRV
jgi:hypothetical protein